MEIELVDVGGTDDIAFRLHGRRSDDSWRLSGEEHAPGEMGRGLRLVLVRQRPVSDQSALGDEAVAMRAGSRFQLLRFAARGGRT